MPKPTFAKSLTLKTRIAFIINPISGGINKEKLPQYLLSNIDDEKFETKYFFTRSAEHTKELAKQALAEQFDIVVAVGGDGTVNNVAEQLAGNNVPMGIIPKGSGNGLARHLGIPMHSLKALALITGVHKVSKIDTGKVNEHFFVNVAGAGFDAHVSGKFATADRRGFWSYTKITLTEFAQYKSRHYQFTIDSKELEDDGFILCVANGSQYGNNAYIAPQAMPDDGWLDVTVLKPFRIIDVPVIGYHLFARTLHKTRYVKTYRGKHIIINRPIAELINIDGEPTNCEKDLTISIQPSSLNIIVPQ